MNYLYKLNAAITIAQYRFKHWIFQWKQDDENDIAFVIANIITFVKYKEHTIVKFGKNTMRIADKYLIE